MRAMVKATVGLALLALLATLAAASPAHAQRGGDLALRKVAERAGQPFPAVELVTMGVGSLIWERHGHIALCIVYDDPMQDACYNYGVANFSHPLEMAAGFFRGTHSFWVEKMDPEGMLSIYVYADRTVWVQPLPFTQAQKQSVVDQLEHDILDANRYYAYDHFWDNCTTRVRDVLDRATGGVLSGMTALPDGRTYRDLARGGFYGMRVPLLITDLAMGRVTDRVPSYFERMFLPDYLREAAEKQWGVHPIAIYTRVGPPPLSDGPSGRLLLALAILGLTAPAWLTRLWGRFERTGLAVALVPQIILGLAFWVLAIISPLPYVRWNESCLVFLPLDVAMVWLSPARRLLYARARLVELALVAVLLAVSVLEQPLWMVLAWPAIPAAVVGLWPRRAQAGKQVAEAA
jgi:hypothetical protein